MALRFMDSFDHYATADLTAKYNSIANSPVIQSGGRYLNCLFLVGTSSPRQVTKILDAQGTWIFGFAVQHNEITQATSTRFLRLMSGGTDIIDVRRISSGFWQVVRNNSTALATSSGALSNDTWYYLEFKVFLSTTVGTFELRMDGVTVASGSGVNTGGSSVDRFMLSGIQQTGSVDDCIIDDLYVCDGTVGAGSNPCNDFLGDCRVESLFPNANGNSSQFVGSDGNSTDNYLLVDETAPNGDTDYVESSTINNKDTYNYAAPTPVAGTVYGVQTLPYVRKTDAGTRTIVPVNRLGSTEDDGSSIALSTSFTYYPQISELDPDGNDWDLTNLAAAEFGIKVT